MTIEINEDNIEAIESAAGAAKRTQRWSPRSIRSGWWVELDALADAMRDGNVALVALREKEALDEARRLADKAAERELERVRVDIVEQIEDGLTSRDELVRWARRNNEMLTIHAEPEGTDGIRLTCEVGQRVVMGEYGVVLGDDSATGSATTLVTF